MKTDKKIENLDEKLEIEHSYTMRLCCSNCGYGDILGIEYRIPKGVKMVHFLMHEECPNCECRTLREFIK